MSPSRHNPRKQRGFTLIETMVAIAVLIVGLVSVAALITQMVSSTDGSRAMSSAAMLATEKLEDLNRFPATDASVAVGGGLGADTPGYFDNVQISSTNGTITETFNGIVITHAADGTTTNVPPAANAPDTLIFDRRWSIEAGAGTGLPNGVRRVTVFVTATNALPRPVTFQSSTVRP
jgi:prepilin-type N-terminal cleavage/methylation domain-containing protein